MALGGGWSRPAAAPLMFIAAFVAMIAVGLPSRAAGIKRSVVGASGGVGMGGVIPMGRVLRLRGAGRGKRQRQEMGDDDGEGEIDYGGFGGSGVGDDGESGDEGDGVAAAGSWGAGGDDDDHDHGVGSLGGGDGESERGMGGRNLGEVYQDEGVGGGRRNGGSAVVRHQDESKIARRKRDKMSSVKASKKKKGKFDWDTWQRIEMKNKEYKPHDLLEPVRGDDGALFQAKFHSGQVLQKQVRHQDERTDPRETKKMVEMQAKAEARALAMEFDWEEAEAIRKRRAAAAAAAAAAKPQSVEGVGEGKVETMTGLSPAVEMQLTPAARHAIESQNKGMRFTGSYRDGLPVYTNDTSIPHPVTGEPMPLPGGQTKLTLSEYDRIHHYLKEGEAPEDLLGVSRVEWGNMTLSQRVKHLKSKKLKLSRRQKWWKDVMGITEESIERMQNGTFVSDSAWGPHKALQRGEASATGMVWGGKKEGLRRKRRDAAWYKEKALKGKVKAQLQLALAYREGQGVKRSLKRAAGWFARASRGGNPQAMHYLAECYRYGEGVKRRNASAVELHTRAAGRGYVLSQRDLGLAILEGRLGMEADGVKGAKWLRKAASHGDRISCSKLGLAYAEGLGGLERDDEKAERYLVRAAGGYKKSEQSSRSSTTVQESGASSMRRLGLRFLKGNGVQMDPLKAIDWFARASLRGDTTATMLLGECYLKGDGVPKDEYVAARQFEKAAAAGNERGMYEFGKLLLNGAEGVEKDGVKARRMFGMAAKQGHGPSCLVYGLCLATGTGGIRSMADGMVWLHAAADDEDNPSVEAMLNLGMAYIRGESIPRNVTRGVVYLEAAAAQGDARACHELGEMKLLGDVQGVKQDAEEAVRLLTDACDAGAGGHTMWLLGRCYAQGDGCEVDDDVAAIWFLKSARDGAEGWGDAGVMRAWRVSEEGERVPPPDIDWAKGAADRGSVGALKLLGWCYDAGVGVTVDEYGREEPIKRDVRAASIAMKELGDLGDEEALYSCGMLLAEAPDKNLGRPLQCFEESAKRGWPPAMRMLGRIHAKGLVGLPKDEQAAVEWYARAAEKGDAEAAYQLGLCYQYGKGVQQDMFLATEYYHDAADEGDADAQFALGSCYGRGKGVKKDQFVSFGWYSLAAKQGHAKAAFNLGLRYTEGLGVGKDPAMAGHWFSVAATKGIFGRKVKVLKGKGGGRQKLQDAYKLEMHISAQETKNTLPGLKTKVQKKSPPRIMPLSEFRMIRWNRNVAKFRKKDDTAGKMIFFEHDKLPRMVKIDDKERSDYGQIFYTLPKRELEDKKIAKLLLKYGTDFKAMRLDLKLNPDGLDKGQLRRMATKMLTRRCKMPSKWLEPKEREQHGQMQLLFEELNEQKRLGQYDRAWTHWALTSDGADNPLGLTEVSRARQLENAREAARQMIMGGSIGHGVTLQLPEEAKDVIGWSGDDGAWAQGKPLLLGDAPKEDAGGQLALFEDAETRQGSKDGPEIEVERGREKLGNETEEVDDAVRTLQIRDGEDLVLPSFMQGSNRID